MTSPAKNRRRKAKEREVAAHASLKGFVLSVVLLVVILRLLPVRYATNDEFSMILALSGKFGVSPDPSAPFLFSAAFHRILCLLYKHAPAVPWLGLFMYLAVFLGSALILGLVFRSREWKYGMLFVPSLALCLGYCFTFISITSASLLLEFSVFVCVMEWGMKERCPVKYARLYALCLAIGFLLSYVLRRILVLWAIGFAIPIFLFVKGGFLKRAWPVLLSLAMLIACDYALLSYTRSDEHKAFAEYNHLRTLFNDTARGEDHGEITEKALEKAGWSRDDVIIFRHWILYDETVFNTGTIGAFINANLPQHSMSTFLGLILKKIKTSFLASKRFTLVLVFSLMSLFLYKLPDLLMLSRRNKVRIIVAMAFIGAAIVYFMYYRFQPRFFVPLYVYFLATSFLLFQARYRLATDQRNGSTARKAATVLTIMLVLLTLGQVYVQGKDILRILTQSKRHKDFIHKCLAETKHRSVHGNPLFVSMDPSYGIRNEYVHPLKELSDYPDIRVFPGGTSINSPPYLAELRRMGLGGGRDFLKWIVSNYEVLLFMTGSKERHEKMRYLWTSYLVRRIVPGRTVRLTPVHSYTNRQGTGLVFYSVISRR